MRCIVREFDPEKTTGPAVRHHVVEGDLGVCADPTENVLVRQVVARDTRTVGARWCEQDVRLTYCLTALLGKSIRSRTTAVLLEGAPCAVQVAHDLPPDKERPRGLNPTR